MESPVPVKSALAEALSSLEEAMRGARGAGGTSADPERRRLAARLSDLARCEDADLPGFAKRHLPRQKVEAPVLRAARELILSIGRVLGPEGASPEALEVLERVRADLEERLSGASEAKAAREEAEARQAEAERAEAREKAEREREKAEREREKAPVETPSFVRARSEVLPARVEEEEPVMPARVEKPVMPARVERPVMPARVEKPVMMPPRVEKPVMMPPRVERPVMMPPRVEKPVMPARVEKPVMMPPRVEKPVTPARVEKPVTPKPATSVVVASGGDAPGGGGGPRVESAEHGRRGEAPGVARPVDGLPFVQPAGAPPDGGPGEHAGAPERGESEPGDMNARTMMLPALTDASLGRGAHRTRVTPWDEIADEQTALTVVPEAHRSARLPTSALPFVEVSHKRPERRAVTGLDAGLPFKARRSLDDDEIPNLVVDDLDEESHVETRVMRPVAPSSQTPLPSFAADLDEPTPAPADSAFPELSFDQYAWLVVSLDVDPARAESTLSQYRIRSPAARAALDAYWGARIAADPGLSAKWVETCRAAREHLSRRR